MIRYFLTLTKHALGSNANLVNDSLTTASQVCVAAINCSEKIPFNMNTTTWQISL